MESEPTIHGEGKAYDFGARIYDGRIGRWWSMDPKHSKYPGVSSFVSFVNSPILFIDPNGEELWISGHTKHAMADLRSVLPTQYGPYLQVSYEGQVYWDLEKFNNDGKIFVATDPGIELIHDLI